jgi:lipoyl(octanoyl) transferase
VDAPEPNPEHATRKPEPETVWFLLQSGSRAAATNMAVDEALLEAIVELGRPVLRFYSWTEPAATFGYFQKYSEVERLTKLRPLIRRPTGGGLVPHDADWTYSLIFPPFHSWYTLKAVQSYQRVHEWIQGAFINAGIVAELSAGRRNELSGQCFAGAERFDLLWQDRKIAGAAQRRSRHGLLIQGSIQAPATVAKADWQKAFCDLAHNQWGVKWIPFDLSPALEERAESLAEQKYSRLHYNEQR